MLARCLRPALVKKGVSMGQSKIKNPADFALYLIDEWEATDCVNFAAGLSRLTGWLLHVDWWSTSTDYIENISLDQLKPLRVYVGNNSHQVFDARGIKSLVDFNQRIILKQIHRKYGTGLGGVHTRFYDEANLSSLPLRNQPDETLIVRAINEIEANPLFLASIPIRTPPYIPAYEAAKFTWGWCAVFAEAMQKLTGLKPVALLAERFFPLFEGTPRSESGYFHSVVMHPDGMAEDAWGKTSLKDIANRFGVIDFTVSENENRTVLENLKRNSSDRYEITLKDAMDLIKKYRK